MIGALGFLIVATLRNRIVRQLARLRSPRYAIAMLVGLAYFWFLFVRPQGGARPPRVELPPDIAATAAGAATFSQFFVVAIAITVILWWLAGGVASALAFQSAEVHFLFPAPLSRRALIGYKVLRSQILVLVNAVIWVLLMGRMGTALSPAMSFVTVWAFFTLVGLHRLGAALVQAPAPGPARRLALLAAKGVAALAALGLVMGVLRVVLRVRGLGFAVGLKALGVAIAEPPAAWALTPFRFAVAPLGASSADAWTGAIAVVLAVVAAHVAWVLAMNVPFEETAAAVSAKLARRLAEFRERRAGGAVAIGSTKVKRDWLPLRPVGRRWVAIVWKNTLALVRSGGMRSIVLLAVMAAVLATVVSQVGRSSRSPVAALIPLLVIAAMMLLLGPRTVRNDLRQDLLSLPLIKTYPLRGSEVVAAELTSPVVVLTMAQLALLAIAYAATPREQLEQLLSARVLSVLVVSPLVLLALNATGVAIQNAAALMFPAWVRLGPDQGGIETMGQNILFVMGSTLALMLALVPAALVATVAFGAASVTVPGLEPGVAALAGAAVLGLEVWWLVRRLGRLFERTEPSAIG